MNYSFSLCEYFYQISIEQYEIYVISRKELDEVANHEKSFDILSHSPEEDIKFKNLYDKTISSAISFIVFQAFAVEAYMNFYGAKKIGDKEFISHYDRISIIDKIVIVSKIATSKDFPKGEHVFELVRRLFRQRDKLVHYKSKAIDIGSCSEEDFCKHQYNCYEFIFDGIEEITNTYPQLKATLAKMENKQIDLFSEQLNEAFTEMKKQLEEMVQKAFYSD